MLPILNRIRTWWTNADRNQRVVTLGGIGALLLLFVGTVFFATRPHYEVLLENLSDMDKNAAVEALNGFQIPNQFDQGGVIKVPAERVAEARMKLASAGKIPSGPHHLSFPDLAKVGPMVSPEIESQTVKAILEGEIASTLETMDGVAAARVIITQPKDTVFATEKEAPSASVTLTEKGEGSLTAPNGNMVAKLVCAAVQGMKTENVYVGTSNLRVLWDGHGGELPSSKGELDFQTARSWEGRIQSALDEMFGSHNTRVIVRADVDTTQKTTKVHEENPTANPTASVTTQEKMANGKRTAGGLAGAPSNIEAGQKAAAAPASPAGKDSSYDKKGKQEEFGNNISETTIEGGSGGLKALSITVAVNSEKITDVAGVEGIVNGVMASDIETDATGAVKPNQKFTVKIQPVKFDNTAAIAAKELDDKRASAARTQQILSLLPIVVILVVALLVAKQVGKISRAILPALPAASETLAEGEEDTIEYDLGGEMSALPAGVAGSGMVPAGSSGANGPAFILTDGDDSPLSMDRIRDRVNLPLETIKQMATDRPELVATLIKSMMLEKS